MSGGALPGEGCGGLTRKGPEKLPECWQELGVRGGSWVLTGHSSPSVHVRWTPRTHRRVWQAGSGALCPGAGDSSSRTSAPSARPGRRTGASQRCGAELGQRGPHWPHPVGGERGPADLTTKRPRGETSRRGWVSQRSCSSGAVHSGRSPNSVPIRGQRRRVSVRKGRGTVTAAGGRHFSRRGRRDTTM